MSIHYHIIFIAEACWHAFSMTHKSTDFVTTNGKVEEHSFSVLSLAEPLPSVLDREEDTRR